MQVLTEERKKMLEQAGVQKDVVRFLEEQDIPMLHEWSFLCAMDGMSAEDIKRVCREAGKQRSQASGIFMEERDIFMRRTYETNKELSALYTDLLHRVEIMYERTHALEEGLTGKLSEAMQEKDRVFGQMIETKDMVIRASDKQIADYKKEVIGLREDNRTLLEKNAGLREQIISLEAKLKAAQNRISSMELNSVQAGNDKKEDKAAGRENDGTGPAADEIQVIPYNRMMFEPVSRRKRWGFFNKGERLAEEFIRLYMENDDYNDEQRDYLIKCLEQGDTLDVIKEFASPNLSVAHMDWLRRITYKRMR